MRAYREQDFEKMAERIVDRFMRGENLADAATKEASSNGLNANQIARMVHAANTTAFLRLMDEQKKTGSADMTGEFDPIDVSQIVKKLVASVDVPDDDEDDEDDDEDEDEEDDDEDDEDDEDNEDELPDEMEDRRRPHMSVCVDPPEISEGPFPKAKSDKEKEAAYKRVEKTASFISPYVKDSATQREFRARRLRKFASVLEDQYKQAEWAFEDEFTKLSACFKKANNATNLASFEKDALALHGHDVGFVVLNMVRDARGEKPLEFESARAKVAALNDRHLVEESDAIHIFSKLVKIASEAIKLRNGAQHVRSLCS